MDSLPQATTCLEREVREFIETKQLMGKGIGYIDAHLLAYALVSGVNLWTADKRLQQIACSLDCGHA